MSDVPQQTGPDLHAIFGIDGDPSADEDPVISVERAAPDHAELDADAGTRADVDIADVDIGYASDPLTGSEGEHEVTIDPLASHPRVELAHALARDRRLCAAQARPLDRR